MGLSNATATSLHARMMDSIVDTSATAYPVVDNDGVLMFANASARRLLDVGEADVGRPFQDLAISDRPTELRTHIDEVRLHGRPLRLEHQNHQRRPSEPMRLTIDITPLGSHDGKPFAIQLASATPLGPAGCNRNCRLRRRAWKPQSRNCSWQGNRLKGGHADCRSKASR